MPSSTSVPANRRRPTTGQNQPAVAIKAVKRGTETPNTPLPKSAFSALGVPEQMVRALVAMDRTNPFPVQSATLPDSLKGSDLCVKAPTGSGKTLAFALPIAILTKRSENGRPHALILLPTRELVTQVADTLLPLTRTQGLRVATLYGGTNIKRDLQLLRRGVDVLIATPGRLADLVKRREARLDEVNLVVVDEADRMADMGFLPEVIRLLDLTLDNRQTLLFSATLDGDVDQLIRRYQNNPVRHTVVDELSSPTDVRHLFWQAHRDVRRKLANDVLRTLAPAIVFTRTKHGADRLTKQLQQDGIAAAAIHGDRSQRQREAALKSFRNGEVTTLVATDVAARGIHVDRVALVVHYDLPACDKDYQHRSGRTGRAGETGVVVSFVDPAQHKDAAAIQRSLDLPQGLHDIDPDQLTSDAAPVVAMTFNARPHGAQRPSQNAARAKARNQHRKPASAAKAATGSRSGKPDVSARNYGGRKSIEGQPSSRQRRR
ncbi:MAG: DEAD/DEAH box helicase [Nitriliruptoraceae bacterium]